MRILVHDFGGYPYPIQLSRALAARGHTVLHAYCSSLTTTPLGSLQPQPGDAETLEIRGIALARPLEKYSYVRRWRQENEFGTLVAELAKAYRADVVLSANAPLDTQRALLKAARSSGSRFVFWVQDLVGIAAHRLLRRKNPLLGATVGRYYAALEQKLLRRSDAAVLITDDFKPYIQAGAVPGGVHTIENWAPLEELPLRPKDNEWARANGLTDTLNLVYTGTLGMKHNPELLLELARRFKDDPRVRIVVLSQGLGADWLREKRDALGLSNLVLQGFLPFKQMPDVMGASDVLLAVLEPDAGVFSVPSKVLSYFCAARPILLAVPPENLSARLVSENQAGFVTAPDDTAGFVAKAESLVRDPELRERLGLNARAYAERAFDIRQIADAFERVLAQEP